MKMRASKNNKINETSKFRTRIEQKQKNNILKSVEEHAPELEEGLCIYTKIINTVMSKLQKYTSAYIIWD